MRNAYGRGVFLCLKFHNAVKGLLANVWQLGLLGCSEAAENEVDIADFRAQFLIISAETQAGELAGLEGSSDRFEAVVPAAGAVVTQADRAEFEIKIITNYENLLRWYFVILSKSLDGLAGIIIVSLRFDKNRVSLLEPEGIKLWFLPS